MTEDSAHEPAQDSGPEPHSSAGEKPRRVPKTMLFNVPTPEAIEAYAASHHRDVQVSTSEEAINTEKVLPVVEQAASAEELEKKRQTAQKQSARRVAKTLLFNEINLDAVKQAAQAASAAAELESAEAKPADSLAVPEVVSREKRVRKIAKTLQESALGSFGQEQLHVATESSELAAQALPAGSETAPEASLELAPKPKRQHFVAKTMLDHSILWDTVSKFEAKMEERVAEQLLERAHEPVKPFIAIECKKKATPCAFVWDATDSKERFRYCDLCRTPVYNFAGLEQPEADELIFQRENRRNATLYKRADGNYMTVNCPVEVKRKRDMVYMSIGGVLLFVASIAFMILMPRPPKPEPKAVVEDSRTVGVNTSAPSTRAPNPNQAGQPSQAGQTPPAGSDDGSFHMVNGQRVYPTGTSTGPGAGSAPVNFPPPVQTPAATTDADESGQFWQYDGPPPGQR